MAFSPVSPVLRGPVATLPTVAAIASTHALRIAGRFCSGNTLYIDSPDHHLSDVAQNLHGSFAALAQRVLSGVTETGVV
jgi:hypothetical protein